MKLFKLLNYNYSDWGVKMDEDGLYEKEGIVLYEEKDLLKNLILATYVADAKNEGEMVNDGDKRVTSAVTISNIRKIDEEFIDSLLDKGVEFNSNLAFRSVVNDDLDALIRLIEKRGFDAKACAYDILKLAIDRGRLQFIKYAIEELKADITSEEYLFAQLFEDGRLECIKYLIENLGYKEHIEKSTDLYLASAYGHADVVRYLVDNGSAALCAKNECGFTDAMIINELEIVKIYLENGFDINGFDGIVVLQATEFESYHILKYFLENNLANEDSIKKALIRANERGYEDIAELLKANLK